MGWFSLDSNMKRCCLFISVLMALGAGGLGVCCLALADGHAALDYATQIAPIFEQKCLSCHSKSIHMGGLVMDSYEAVMKGGDHGPMVAPGNWEASLMVRMLEAADLSVKQRGKLVRL